MRNERSKLNYTLVVLVLAGAGAAAPSTYSVVYSFTGGAGGANPNTPLIRDSAGNLYGTTVNGGNTACEGGCGIIFKVTPGGKLTVMYGFTGGPDGANPYTGLFQDSAGNFYGTSAFGGAKGYGVVFELDTTGTETPLYTFQGGADGANPYSALVQDAGGNLYGTTAFGGGVTSSFPSGCGVVFKIDTGGTFSVVHTFTGRRDGATPYGGVILDSSGNLYGTAEFGTSFNDGVVYRIDTTGQFKTLYTFEGGTGGANPYAGLFRDSNGNLYGATVLGGSSGSGTVYKLRINGTLDLLHSFTGGSDGGNPYGGVYVDLGTDGGTQSFGPIHGAFVYGTTQVGGSGGDGVVYRVQTPENTLVVEEDFTGLNGAGPVTTMTKLSILDGTTAKGGASGAGLIYKFR